jgi:hypothetical protein
VEEIAQNQAAQNPAAEDQNNDIPPGNTPPPEQKPGADKKEAPVMPSKMTVDQYLKRAPQGAGISDLVRSLYKTKIMSYEDWENTVKTLLKKQVR